MIKLTCCRPKLTVNNSCIKARFLLLAKAKSDCKDRNFEDFFIARLENRILQILQIMANGIFSSKGD